MASKRISSVDWRWLIFKQLREDGGLPLKALGMLSIVALTVPSGLFAQTYLSDATICRRAINPERSGWVEGSDYAQEASRRGLTFRACDELNNPAPLAPYADKSRPTFLEAGIFFMTGHEPPDRVRFQVRPDGTVSAIVRRYRREPHINDDARWEFKLSLDKPCTIMGYRIEPPYEIERLEFLKLPSPRAMRTDPKFSPVYPHLMDIPPETWCHAKAYMNDAGAIDLVKDTTKCDLGVLVGLASDAPRRVAALNYIRRNFCAGQPEPPPPPPPKPY